MPKFRMGTPLKGDFSHLGWNSIAVFEVPQMLRSFALGGIVTGLLVVAWRLVDPVSLPFRLLSHADFLVVVAAVLAHEALHLAGFPRLGLDSRSVFGIWPQMVAPYVQYLLPMARNRFLLALLLPFLVLSILPLAVVSIGIGPVAELSWISIGNCVGASSDLFIFCKVLALVPRKALILESNGKIYWTQAQLSDTVSLAVRAT